MRASPKTEIAAFLPTLAMNPHFRSDEMDHLLAMVSATIADEYFADPVMEASTHSVQVSGAFRVRFSTLFDNAVVCGSLVSQVVVAHNLRIDPRALDNTNSTH